MDVCRQLHQFRRRRTALKTEELNSRQAQQWKELIERCRTNSIPPVLPAARPNQAHLEFAVFVCSHWKCFGGRDWQTRNFGRHGFKRRLHQVRQTHQSGMSVKGRNRLAKTNQLRDALHASNQRMDRHWADDYDGGAALRKQRNVADEMEDVANALLRVK